MIGDKRAYKFGTTYQKMSGNLNQNKNMRKEENVNPHFVPKRYFRREEECEIVE